MTAWAAPPDPARRPFDHRSRAGLLAASAIWLASITGALVQVWLWLPPATSVGGERATALSVVMLAPVLAWFASLGWLLVRRLPGQPVAWLLLGTAPLGTAAFCGIALGQQLMGGDAALAGAIGTLGVTLLIPFFLVPLTFVPLVFPDGRLPGPRWRLPVAVLVAMLLVVVVGLGFAPGQVDPGVPPNPLAIPFLPPELRLVAVPLSLGSILWAAALGVVSMIVRFRRGRGDERQQVKWLLAALIVFAAINVPTFSGSNSELVTLLGPVSLALLPAAVTVAILRYRLYDIDHLVSRTLTYLVVTAAIVVVFAVGNLALQSLLASLTAGNTLAVAASTLLALAAAQPIRRRVQDAVDRRFDRSRVDATLATAAFAARQRDEVDLGVILDDVRATTAGALRPAAIGIWLRTSSDGRSAGTPGR